MLHCWSERMYFIVIYGLYINAYLNKLFRMVIENFTTFNVSFIVNKRYTVMVFIYFYLDFFDDRLHFNYELVEKQTTWTFYFCQVLI